MKKLYSKGKVHPSPPAIADHLSLLPATILTLTVALSPQDREVLAYLISCSPTSKNFSGHQKTTRKGGLGGGSGGGSSKDHPSLFQCDCFRCYMSYWARWDTSPNRQLIHEIIDAYEDRLYQKNKKKDVMKIKKERRKRVCNVSDEDQRDSGESEPVVEVSCGGGVEVKGEDGGQVGLENKGSLRRLVSFIGERIWGVWGI
ncbi:uncharacterized protein LOC132308013 [Cornus florida]|uniref:uncharacterized protein LOC132308013 n=1 Tax=Cornus florida TaxID=4283 RepID=UPI00289AA492|nr:uncharacterized protein LOC132308013 [Cornus florida]